MRTEEILNWIQTNRARITIKQGQEALEVILANGGPEVLASALRHNPGSEGYWVEISINADCAGWSYRDGLIDAIQGAFHVAYTRY